ncbi:type II toxin-antitoxin system HicB family antitoxin [Dehalococcoidia bacterium]|nr:type II toxin-antitoxin system HicB family antitoxin [Dehalococcoidia bacterium]MCL0091176.1 type II toxin-antitoxin system HicB family antitoxin [Dehalococcoidia bacterium]
MGSSNPREAKTRMIHVRLPEDMHKKLRIRTAETDVTIQDWVLKVIQRELARQDTQAVEK